MKKVFLVFSIIGLLLCCAACANGRSVDDSPVRVLDLNRYLGRWYEIARFDHGFEKGIEYAKAVYTLNPDGTVRVENTGFKKGKFKRSIGRAKLPNPAKEPGRLRVSFFGPFYSDYRVLMIDPDYSYALVSSKGSKYLWILSREKDLPYEVQAAILEEAQSRGFDIHKIKWVEQDD